MVLSMLFLFFLNSGLNAQDLEFTQFYNNPLFTNPAMAGAKTCSGQSILNYRNQWPAVYGGSVTTTLSAHQNIQKLHGAVGGIFYHKTLADGLLRITNYSQLYAFKLELKQDVELRFALEPQYIDKKVDFSRIRNAGQTVELPSFVIPSVEPLENDPINLFNLNSGIYISDEKFSVGFALHNILEPVQTFYGTEKSVISRRFTIHGAYKFIIGELAGKEHSIEPVFLYRDQKEFDHLDLVLLYNIGPAMAGVSLRNFGLDYNALGFTAGVRIWQFRLTYSMDTEFNIRQANSPAAHEFALVYDWCKVE